MKLSRRALLLGRFRGPEEVATEAGPAARFINWLNPKQETELPTPTPKAGRVARLLPFNCMNKLGGFCSSCVEHCPVPGAISLQDRLPSIDAEACTGCGDCVDVCPAPGKALILTPR